MIVAVSGLLVNELGEPVGSAGSGKDTLVDMLPHTQKIALADPVKRAVQDAYGFSDDQLWGPSANRNAPDLRYPRNHTWVEAPQVRGYSCACCGQEVGRIGARPDNDAATQCYLSPRYALVTFGTSAGRHCYDATWIDLTVRIAEDLINSKGLMEYRYNTGLRCVHVTRKAVTTVAVPDVRFLNEFYRLREKGAKMVRIRRIGQGLANAAGMHPSEREVAEIPDNQFDCVIENDGSLEDLRAKVPQVTDLLIS